MKLLSIVLGQTPMFRGTVTNDFVPFCPTDTGTNLLSQSVYLASPDLPIGNQPGVASSQLVNKSVRQATAIASAIAQFVSNVTTTSVLDNNTPITLLSQMFGAFGFLQPVVTIFNSGSGTFNLSYKFKILSGNATAAATYSDGTNTFTVVTTISAGLELIATGPAAPVTASGTLSKTGGTGDATITYNAYRAPSRLYVRAIGGGGAGGSCASATTTAGAGGGGSGGGTCESIILAPSLLSTYAYAVGSAGVPGATGNVAGGNGGNTTFGTALITASGGSGGGGSAASASLSLAASGSVPGGAASGGNVSNIVGGGGGGGMIGSNTNAQAGQGGGSSISPSTGNLTNGPGSFAASGPGGGGGGGVQVNNNGAQAGGAGGAGQIFLIQYYQ